MPNITVAVIHRQRARYVANALTLATAYGDVLWNVSDVDGLVLAAGSATTAWLDKGDAETVTIDGAWVTATGTPLKVKVWGTNDIAGVVIAPLAYIPSVAGSGATPAYPQEVAFAKADWGNAATDYVAGVVLCRGFRYVKVQANAADASGSFTAGAWAGPPVRI